MKKLLTILCMVCMSSLTYAQSTTQAKFRSVKVDSILSNTPSSYPVVNDSLKITGVGYINTVKAVSGNVVAVQDTVTAYRGSFGSGSPTDSSINGLGADLSRGLKVGGDAILGSSNSITGTSGFSQFIHGTSNTISATSPFINGNAMFNSRLSSITGTNQYDVTLLGSYWLRTTGNSLAAVHYSNGEEDTLNYSQGFYVSSFNFDFPLVIRTKGATQYSSAYMAWLFDQGSVDTTTYFALAQKQSAGLNTGTIDFILDRAVHPSTSGLGYARYLRFLQFKGSDNTLHFNATKTSEFTYGAVSVDNGGLNVPLDLVNIGNSASTTSKFAVKGDNSHLYLMSLRRSASTTEQFSVDSSGNGVFNGTLGSGAITSSGNGTFNGGSIALNHATNPYVDLYKSNATAIHWYLQTLGDGTNRLALTEGGVGNWLTITPTSGLVTLLGAIDGAAAITDTSAFTTTATRKAVYISGCTSTDKFAVSIRNADGDDTLPVEYLSYYAKADTLVVLRNVGTTSGLKFSYIRVR